MNQELQNLIQRLCSGLLTHDVSISQIFDLRRFAQMTHYAWKHEVGFHPDMFKKSLKETKLFRDLSDEVLDEKSVALCRQADFALNILRLTSDIDSL